MWDWTLNSALSTVLGYLSLAWSAGSSFLIAAVVAIAGAFFGAHTAQRIADRNRFRDEIVKEVRDTNAAISLSYAICNSVMSMKRQNLRPLKGDFERSRLAVIEHQRQVKVGETSPDTVLQLKVGLLGLAIPSLVTDTLRSHVLDRLSVIGRPLHLAVSASESAASLVEAMNSRNEQIEAFKKAGGAADKAFVARYFGLPARDGEHDEVYLNTLDAMVLHSDSVIFFTYLLCGDLQEHGERLLTRYRRRLGRKNVPRINEVDFSPAKANQLIPPDAMFSDWFTSFVKRPEPVSRWKRAWRVLRGTPTDAAPALEVGGPTGESDLH